LNGIKPFILIGQDNCSLILAKEIIQQNHVLSKTELGWVAHGPVSKLTTNCTALVNICSEDTEDDSHQLVKVENLLNIYLSSDPNDNESITPNHLLLGSIGHVSSPGECFHKKMKCAENNGA
jgi:hypothetical protein